MYNTLKHTTSKHKGTTSHASGFSFRLIHIRPHSPLSLSRDRRFHKVDFGCLEDDGDNPLTGVADDEYHLFDREEEPGVGCLSDLDDQTTVFSKV